MKIKLFFLFLLFSQFAIAGQMLATATLPTTRADLTAFDPLVELGRVEIGCGTSMTGPFDVFTDVTNRPFSSIQFEKVITIPQDIDFWCVAFAVDTAGRASSASNVAFYEYTAPPASLELLEMVDVPVTGTVNFSFTIGTN